MIKVLKRIICSGFFLLLYFISFSQDDALKINFLKQSSNPGDTISFDASFSVNNTPVPTGTLYTKIVDNQGKIWNMRWPILNGVCQVDMHIPDSFPFGDLTFYFAASQRFFTVYGHLNAGGKIQKLKSTLMTAGKEFLMEDIKVEDGNFVYRNKIFEGEAILFLKREKGSSDDIDISIMSLLDSSFIPNATVTKTVSIGKPLDTTIHKPVFAFQTIDSVIAANGKMLETVVVTAKKLSRAQQFSEKYSTGLFRSINERLIDMIDDPSALTSFDVLNYLSGRVAGLIIRNPMGGDPTATWRNDPVTFYIDEMRVDIQTVRMLVVSDIAIVKAFPPPFFGNMFGEGGAIAIYTKRGEFIGNGNRRNFRIKGYTPFVTTLPVKPDHQ